MLSLLHPPLPRLLPVEITEASLAGWEYSSNNSQFSLRIVNHEVWRMPRHSVLHDDRIERTSAVLFGWLFLVAPQTHQPNVSFQCKEKQGQLVCAVSSQKLLLPWLLANRSV